MFRVASSRFALPAASGRCCCREGLLGSKGRSNEGIIRQSRAHYIRGHWPEPITQQTLSQFLRDINYFEEPRKFQNIGLDTGRDTLKSVKNDAPNEISELTDTNQDDHMSSGHETVGDVDTVLGLLGEETSVPAFDVDDAAITSDQLMNLAISFGIYRDLFGKYIPTREHIKFTQEQAKKLDLMVPHFWITDMPFARAEVNPKEPEPLQYFEPVIGISARFVHNANDNNQDGYDQYAHTAYHGNIIPASEALVKPSITLDGHWLSPDLKNQLKDSQFENWSPGKVSAANFARPSEKFHTIALLNLDSLHPDSANLHWMLTNISLSKSSTKGGLSYDEVCDYLPTFGVRGFGYSRYVFLVLQHDTKLDPSQIKIADFSLESRKFDTKSFIEQHKLTAVGLSWFQTTWDESSNKIFHDYLKMRAPIYEHVQRKPELNHDLRSQMYPGRIPFNVMLDHARNKKEINEQVLLERLKSVNPFDYKDQYVPPKVPPTVFQDDVENLPSWMHQVMFKKKNKVGYWRGLRPASAILPLNNNADLDYPLRPVESSKKKPPHFPNSYDHHVVTYKRRLIREMAYSKPPNEHQSVYVEDDHEVHLDEVRKMMEEFKPQASNKPKTSNKAKSKKESTSN